MNAFTRFSLDEDSTCCPQLNIVENLEVIGSQVSFTLINSTRSFIDVTITGIQSLSFIDVDGHDVDIDVVTLHGGTGVITQVDDVLAAIGWPIQLTDKQEKLVNDLLQDYFEELAKQKFKEAA